jgi:hypothetical protein
MAVGIGGAAPHALADVFGRLALVAPGAARMWPAALAATFLVGLATIPPAQGADALATVSALQIAEATIRAAEIVCARHLAKDAPPGTEGLLWEPAFYEPCSELHTRLEAAQFAAERLVGDGEIPDRDILRQAGLVSQPH